MRKESSSGALGEEPKSGCGILVIVPYFPDTGTLTRSHRCLPRR